MKKTFLSLVLAGAFGQITTPAQADWTLDQSQSVLAFSSIKASRIAEIHTFNNIRGNITNSGNATFEIDVSSLETMIPIRNERMLEMLFKEALFPIIEFSSSLDLDPFNNLAVNEEINYQLSGDLNIVGLSENLTISVSVRKLDEDKVQVSNNGLFFLDPGRFGLINGIEALREIAGLPSITQAVPVDFTLVFDQK